MRAVARKRQALPCWLCPHCRLTTAHAACYSTAMRRLLDLLCSSWCGPGFAVSQAVCRLVLGAVFVLAAGFGTRLPLAADAYLYPEHPAAAGFFWTDYAA